MIQRHWSRTKLVYISAKRAAFEFRQANDDAMVFDATLSTLCVPNGAREAVKSETDFHRNRAADSAPRPSTALKEDSVHFAKVLKATERDSVSRGQTRRLRFLRSAPSNHLSHMRWHFDFFFNPRNSIFVSVGCALLRLSRPIYLKLAVIALNGSSLPMLSFFLLSRRHFLRKKRFVSSLIGYAARFKVEVKRMPSHKHR